MMLLMKGASLCLTSSLITFLTPSLPNIIYYVIGSVIHMCDSRAGYYRIAMSSVLIIVTRAEKLVDASHQSFRCDEMTE